MAKYEPKSESASENLGLSEQMKFDPKTPPRPEVSEATQRPLASKETIKSDRGTFKTK